MLPVFPSNLNSQCQCNQDHFCSYTKHITALVTLNTTASDFNNINNVKSSFVNAVANAAGGGTPAHGGLPRALLMWINMCVHKCTYRLHLPCMGEERSAW